MIRMSSPQAVFLDYDSAVSTDLDTRGLTAVLPKLQFFDRTLQTQLAERIRDAEIVLLDQCALRREALLAAPRLRLIALAATGFDNIDLPAAQERGIAVCNIRGYCTSSVAQHVWSMILSLTQRLPEYRELATGGAWVAGAPINLQAHPVRELAGRILGIVGWGDLGHAVAKIGECFGMRVLVANRAGAVSVAGRHELRELLALADVVSLHCPLTATTRGMIGAAELKLMKPDALLINTARGSLIDSAALADALKSGRLGGAGIDVLAHEPPIDGDPLLDPAIPRLLVTPHVAWAARESRQRILDELTANVRDFLNGGRRGRIA
jgi:glycerate dehydrogenase